MSKNINKLKKRRFANDITNSSKKNKFEEIPKFKIKDENKTSTAKMEMADFARAINLKKLEKSEINEDGPYCEVTDNILAKPKKEKKFHDRKLRTEAALEGITKSKEKGVNQILTAKLQKPDSPKIARSADSKDGSKNLDRDEILSDEGEVKIQKSTTKDSRRIVKSTKYKDGRENEFCTKLSIVQKYTCEECSHVMEIRRSKRPHKDNKYNNFIYY